VLCAVIASATDSELLLLTNISTYVTHLHLCFETGYTVQAIQKKGNPIEMQPIEVKQTIKKTEI
jgi:hypothetical protein